jgi:hypothetical protein
MNLSRYGRVGRKHVIIMPSQEQPKQSPDVAVDIKARGVYDALTALLRGNSDSYPYRLGFLPEDDIPPEELMIAVPSRALEFGRTEFLGTIVHDVVESWKMTKEYVKQGHPVGTPEERLFAVFRNSDDPELVSLAEAMPEV